MLNSYGPSDREGIALRRIRSLSGTMQWLTTCGAVIALSCMAWIWFGLPDAKLEQVVRELTHASSVFAVHVSLLHRAGGFLATGIGLGLLVCALYQARQMFVAFGRGEALTAETAIRLRRIAMALTALGLSIPLIRLLAGLLLVGAPGEPYWVLVFSLGDYFVSLLGGLLLAIAWAMVVAARVAEENKGFV